MWELDYKEIWLPKNWCFWTVVLEKTLESPLDCKEIQPVHPKGDQSCSLEGLMLKLKLNSLATSCEELTHLKRPWCSEDWGQEKGTIEDEILYGITDSMDMGLGESRNWWWTGRPHVLQFMGLLKVIRDEWLNWTDLHNWDCWYFSQQSWFQLMFHPVQRFSWCTLHIS